MMQLLRFGSGNIWKLTVFAVCSEMIFAAAIIVPFLGSFGLSMQQILITQAFFAGIITILEVPSGYFADVYGRRLSLLIGVCAWIAGAGFSLFSSDFYLFVVGALLWGMGSSFTSGANEALLYESLQEEGRTNEYKRIQGNFFFYCRLGAIAAGIIGGVLATYSLRGPFWATLVPFFVCLGVALSLKESAHTKHVHEKWKHIQTILRESLCHSALIRALIFFGGISGFFIIEFWLKQKYMEDIGIPLALFGVFFAGMNLASGLGGKYTEWVEKRVGLTRCIYAIVIIPPLVMVGLGVMPFLWGAIPLLFLSSFFWTFTTVILQDALQHTIASDRRATILSIVNLLGRALFLVLAPLLGWVTDVYSIHSALIVCGLVMAFYGMLSILGLRSVKII